MARSFLRLVDHNAHTFFNLFTLSFPIVIISIFLTWAASSSSLPSYPSTSSATAASNFLSPRGYSLFASALLSPSFNATGTILAPPDFSLILAAKTFLHAPPRASLSLLLFHTLNAPLSYKQLTSIADDSELHTLSGDNCLFLFKKSNGDVTIAVNKKRSLSVTIRQPDLYVDDHLTVHGIDGVLDLNSASTCSGVNRPTARIKAHVDRMFLDHSIRALKRRGFTVVATAMAIKRRDLMRFNGVTVFAVTDASLFSVVDGFHYDFSHHVVKKRMRLTEISRVPIGTVMETMSPNKPIVLGESQGRVTVNGVEINVTEVYQNRWIVVISVLRSLDDVVESFDDKALVEPLESVPSIPPEDSVASSTLVEPLASVPSIPPEDSVASSTLVEPLESVPSIPPVDSVASSTLVEPPESVPSPAPIYYPEDENVAVVAPSPDEYTARCLSEVSDGGDSAVFVSVEGEEVFCPVSVRRKLDQIKSADVAPSDLVSGSKEYQSEPLMTSEVLSESKGNDEKKKSKREDQYMADDLFFYT